MGLLTHFDIARSHYVELLKMDNSSYLQRNLKVLRKKEKTIFSLMTEHSLISNHLVPLVKSRQCIVQVKKCPFSGVGHTYSSAQKSI